MTNQVMTIDPVRVSVTVPLSVDDAWQLFTGETHTWWPLRTHSIHHDEATAIDLEPRSGGEIRERTADGRTAHWGRVLAWEPPQRLVLAWDLGPRKAAAGTEVEVRFAATDGGTRVDLEHRAWERLGDAAAEERASYQEGWPVVLGGFEERARSRAGWSGADAG